MGFIIGKTYLGDDFCQCEIFRNEFGSSSFFRGTSVRKIRGKTP
jgi:hypothetical protein